MTIVLYPTSREPWKFRLKDEGVITEGSAEKENMAPLGITVAGAGAPEYTPTQESEEGITDSRREIIYSVNGFSKKAELDLYMEPDMPFSMADTQTILSYIKSSYPPSYFDTYELFLEDSQGNKRRYAIKNTDVGSFKVRYSDIFVEDEDFNPAYLVRAGFTIKHPKEDIKGFFRVFIEELSLSRLGKPSYCQPQDVINFLGLKETNGKRVILTQESSPSYDDVCNHILEAEAFIDAQTRTSFKINREVNELHDEKLGRTMPYGGLYGIYRGAGMPMMYGGQLFEGVPVSLVKQNIQPIDYSLGDRVEVRRLGTLWETLPESRLWWDEQKGIIWIKDYFHRPDSSVRVTYRWGQDKVPADITKCCKLQACKQIVATDWYRANFPVNPEIFSPMKEHTLDSWTWEIKDIIRGYQTQVSVGML